MRARAVVTAVMQRLAVLLLVCAAAASCGSDGDEAGGPDASADAPWPTCIVHHWIRCMSSSSHVQILPWYGPDAPMNPLMCLPPRPMHEQRVACAGGCAIELAEPFLFANVTTPLYDAAAFCAETPEAQVGDACSSTLVPCAPTRARLNADGTVAGQSYLACGAGGTCEVAPAPAIAGYLQPCSASTVADLPDGMNGARPVAGADIRVVCLFAWNDSTQSIAHGLTRRCLGDWECPEGALCDAVASNVAVCKPGPRGVLTPAMLPN